LRAYVWDEIKADICKDSARSKQPYQQSSKKVGLLAMKPGLYANINRRRAAGTSRSKSKSTISKAAYANMKAGFPKKKKKKA